MPKREKKGLGPWFPSATVIKGVEFDASVTEITIVLFYCYVLPTWSEVRKEEAISEVSELSVKLNLGGRLRVAQEGINATVTGTHAEVVAFTDALKAFDDSFKSVDFKFIEHMPLDRAFGDLKILPVKELVYYGIDNEHTLGQGGVHLDPQAYHDKLSEAGSETVVIDVRNTYESDIGRFQGQVSKGGATLIDPGMRKSTDFPSWIAKPETREKLKGKQVLMYCTGGVRCERASALLKREYGDDINEVYQLQGGIEKYLQTFKDDGGHWIGKNFVFDKREAFGVEAPEGVGGVLKAPEKKKSKSALKRERKEQKGHGGGATAAKVLSKCAACHAPWDRYIGKRKCLTCEVPVLVCESCCTKGVGKAPKPSKAATSDTDLPPATTTTDAPSTDAATSGDAAASSSGKGKDKNKQKEKDNVKNKPFTGLLRCTLCVKEGCTVAARALTLTDNGRKVNTNIGVRADMDADGGGKARKAGKGGKPQKAVAASTVCVWGGGGGAKKRERNERRGFADGGEKRARSDGGDGGFGDEDTSRFAAMPCKFGEDCKRMGCWFSHPGRE